MRKPPSLSLRSPLRLTPLAVLAVLLACGVAAQARAGGAAVHTEPTAAERMHPNRPAKPADADPAQRRQALREALLAQRERQSSPDASPRERRQLTPEERLELRQQIRQQRKESLRQEAQGGPSPKP